MKNTVITKQYMLDLSRKAIHLFLNKDIPKFLKYLEDDFVWVGDCDYLYMNSKEMFQSTIAQEAAAPPVDIASEDYSVSLHNGTIWVIYGRCTAIQFDEKQTLHTKFHFTFVWNVKNKIPRLAQAMACHISDADAPENAKTKISKVFEQKEVLSVRNEKRIAVREVGLPTIHYFTVSEIPYIHSSDKYSIFHTADGGAVTTCKPLRTYEDENFIRIHNSYLVNLNYIKEMEGNSLVLINKERIPIGKKYRKALIHTLPQRLSRSKSE